MKLHTVLVGGTWARRDLGPALGGRGLCGHGLVHGPVRHELKFCGVSLSIHLKFMFVVFLNRVVGLPPVVG